MKRIQPFTISTKLSIPVESKCAECADIYQAAPTATDKLINTQNQLTKDCSDPQSPHALTQQVDPAAVSPVEDFPEDQTLDSPSSSSRSIKKIAICASGETQEEKPDAVPRQSQGGINADGNNSINSNNGSTPDVQPVQGEREDISSQLKNEPCRRLKARDLKCSCAVPTCTAQHSDGTAQAQQWELKDFENSLIQLTASLDFREEDPQEKHELRDFSSEKLQESEDMDDHDRPWLRLHTLLKNYQKDLMLALDVSNFYQQADNLIKTINSKRRSVSLPNNQGRCVDTEIGEIASQIRMLSETASRLADLHPTLASRVTRKQAEVKHSWARLQDTLRNQRAEDPQVPPQYSANEKLCGAGSTATVTAAPSSPEPEVLGIMGKDIKEEQNRLKGVEDTLDLWDRGRLMLMTDTVPESSTRAQDAATEHVEEEEEEEEEEER
ncbi:uncharacterized protein LOC134078677 [Sardina pilchardus]|uniref:uncharacterized protein LOC134078677 n=1 Tax=Sardina pilchardus TaxID=27697 RepID=UPI002E13AB7E